MSLVTKILISTSIGVAAIYGVLVAQVFQQEKVVSKKATPEYIAKVKAQDARLSKALKALTSGDKSRMPEVRAAIASMDKASYYRPQFAKAFDQLGDPATAFKLENERVHFLALSMPDDAEMSFYSELADKTGHPKEGLWARGRLGQRGHFRVWEIGTVGALAQLKKNRGRDEVFEQVLSRQTDYGKSLYPAFGVDIDLVRTKMLSYSPAQIKALRDELDR